MEGETNSLVNRMGNNGMCQLPPSRTFKFYRTISDFPSPPVGHVKLSKEPHLYESEITFSPQKVSAHNILYDKLTVIHQRLETSNTFVWEVNHTFS